jgi:cytochrome c5
MKHLLHLAPLLALTFVDVSLAEDQRKGLSGQAVYDKVCHTCHAAGVNKAPKFGDKAAWKPLIREGQKMLSRTSIKGIRGMPAKGGDPSLSDTEVKRAVAYMANAAGGKFKEP